MSAAAILVTGPAVQGQWEIELTIGLVCDNDISHVPLGYLDRADDDDLSTALCGQQLDDETCWLITPLITCEACISRLVDADRAVPMDDDDARAIVARMESLGA